MIIPKLSVVCSVVGAIKPFVMLDTLKMDYHSYFHCIITYGIIIWGNPPYSNNIFKQQKRIVIRIIICVGIRDSCREYFKLLNVLQLSSQYIYILAPTLSG